MASCTGEDGSTGTKYSYAQLEGLWINAGGSKTVAPLAAAIAMAESQGCSAAINPTDNNGTQTSWGLWQISNGTHDQPVQGIRDPATNAQQAVAKYKSDNNTFGDWGTYASGAYKTYLNGSTTPDTNVPTATLDSAPGTVNGNSDVGCLFQIGGGKFFGVVNNPLNVCLISTVGARQMIGGALMIGAGIIGLAAAVILAASAFQHPAATAVVASVTPVRKVVGAVS